MDLIFVYMAQVNQIASAIRTTASAAQADAACIRLLSLSCIVSRILIGCVPEFKDMSPGYVEKYCLPKTISIADMPVHRDDYIESSATDDRSQKEGAVRYDIRFTARIPKKKEKLELIINIEAQNRLFPGYSVVRRGLYYCSRLISSQRGHNFRGSRYDDIRKAYSIWICPSAPKAHQGSICCYGINEQRIEGSYSAKYNDYDLMCMILMFPPRDGTDADGILRLLGVLLSKFTPAKEKREILEKEFNIPMTEEGELDFMCNYGEALVEETTLEHIEDIMKSFRCSEERAMEALNIPVAARDRYSLLLKEYYRQ